MLVVEDDDQVRAVASGILRRLGYEVLEAQSGSEGLVLAGRYPGTIHLLLSDVVMPQTSGPELARRLSARRPQMKVLFMSGYTDDSIVRHGVIAGQVAYLQKPITPDTISRKVREVLDGGPSGARAPWRRPGTSPLARRNGQPLRRIFRVGGRVAPDGGLQAQQEVADPIGVLARLGRAPAVPLPENVSVRTDLAPAARTCTTAPASHGRRPTATAPRRRADARGSSRPW